MNSFDRLVSGNIGGFAVEFLNRDALGNDEFHALARIGYVRGKKELFPQRLGYILARACFVIDKMALIVMTEISDHVPAMIRGADVLTVNFVGGTGGVIFSMNTASLS